MSLPLAAVHTLNASPSASVPSASPMVAQHPPPALRKVRGHRRPGEGSTVTITLSTTVGVLLLW